jgi:hypothetical protein
MISQVIGSPPPRQGMNDFMPCFITHAGGVATDSGSKSHPNTNPPRKSSLIDETQKKQREQKPEKQKRTDESNTELRPIKGLFYHRATWTLRSISEPFMRCALSIS